MRPEASARNVLSTTRARAKMREFRVAEEDFNQLRRDPAILFGLAIAILGDVAATVADQIGEELAIAPHVFTIPPAWAEDEADTQASLRFAARPSIRLAASRTRPRSRSSSEICPSRVQG